jgi:hypothetical protein
MTMAALSMTISPDFTMNIETLRVGMKAERSVYPAWRALLRLTHHVQHPVQEQGRPVPKRRSGQSERLTHLV